MGLSVAIDSQALTRLGGPWARVLGYSPDFLSALFAVGAATALAFALTREPRVTSAAPEAPPPPLPWTLLGLHLGAFTLFTALTLLLFEGRAMVGPFAPIWLAVWLLVGAVTVVLLGLVAKPMSRWFQLVRDHRALLGLGVVVGCGAWLLGAWTDSLWSLLSRWTFVGVEWLLSAVGQEIESDRSRAVLAAFDGQGRAFRVKIDRSCSGFQGIGLVWVFLGLFLWLRRAELRFPHALFLLPVGTVAIWLSNILRIALLIVIGAWVSPEIAQGGFHSQAGWIAFIAVVFGMVTVAGRIPQLHRTKRLRSEYSPSPAYLVPLMVLAAMSMIGAALATHEIDRLYPVRVMAAAIAVAVFWRGHRRRVSIWDRGSWVAPAAGVAVFIFWWATQGASAESPIVLAELSKAERTTWLASRFVGSGIVVPVVEELAFRGYLMRRLVAADFDRVSPGAVTVVAFVASSVLFGLLHERWLAATAAGMVYAWAYRRRGRLGDAIIAHAVTNLAIGATVLVSGDWAMWL